MSLPPDRPGMLSTDHYAIAPRAFGRLRRRRRDDVRSRRRRHRRRLIALGLLLALLAAIGLTWGRAMLAPSSLPLGVRTVEWIRANGGAGLVNSAERFWYGHHKPKPGGPALKALPAVPAVAHQGPVAVGSTTTTTAAHQPGVAVPLARAPRPWRPPRVIPAARPFLPGEGVWRQLIPPISGTSPLLATVFRPQAEYPRLVAYAAWIDHTRTRLALYPGRYEPPAGSPRGPMSIPFGQRQRVLAAFNSGFAYRDGRGGFAVNGTVYEPLRKGLGTLLAFRDGRVDVRLWQGGAAPPPGVVLARQNLPLIVSGGRPSQALDNSSAWGHTLGNSVLVWRTAVGVDRHGNLVYGAANYQTVRSLALLMIRVGAVRAIELDINPEWPTFNAYPTAGATAPLKFVPNVMQSASRYLVPDDRDFFAVYARRGGGAAVPFR